MKVVLAFVALGLITLTNGALLGNMQPNARLYCPDGTRFKAPYAKDTDFFKRNVLIPRQALRQAQANKPAKTASEIFESFFGPVDVNSRSYKDAVYNSWAPEIYKHSDEYDGLIEGIWQNWLDEFCYSKDPNKKHCNNWNHRNFFCDSKMMGLGKSKYKPACIIHDMCYETYRSKESCDEEFKQNLIASDFGKVYAGTAKWAVKNWGNKRSGKYTCTNLNRDKAFYGDSPFYSL